MISVVKYRSDTNHGGGTVRKEDEDAWKRKTKRKGI